MLGGTYSPRSWRLLAAGLAVGGLAAWLVFANTDMAGVIDILANDVDVRLLGGAFLTYCLFFVGKALRWRYLLSPSVAVPLPRLTLYVLIGYAGNVVLPFQAGEVARGYLASRHHGIRLATALSGIAVEKLLDFLALLVLLIWALLSMEAPSALAEQVAVSLGGLLSLVGVLFVAVLIRPEVTCALVDRALAVLPDRLAAGLGPPIHGGLDGLSALRRAALLWRILAVSLATWSIMLLTLYLTVRAVQLEVPLAVAIVVMVLAAVGLALPTSPGFIGTLQAAFVLGMVPFGIAQDGAVAASLVYQVLTTVPPLVIGAACLALLRPPAACP
jgi:glycosyltransferase 2 family protein